MKTNKIFGFALLATVGLAFLGSCSKSSTDDTLPQIGGYNSADEVGSSDLVAYWPLNGSGVEAKSSTAPSSSLGTTWEAGVKGQGAKLTAGYLKYPSIASFPTTFTAYTLSAWVKVKNNQTEVAGSGSASTILSFMRTNEWDGNLNLYTQTGQRKAIETNGAINDSIVFVQGYRNATSDGSYENLLHLENWMKADNLITPGKHVASPIAVGGTWAHVVGTWEGSTHKFIVYINGKKCSNPAFEVRGANTSMVFDGSATPIIGAFGNFATTTDNWNKPMTGNVDEIRVWKKSLSAADINSLYELEKAGR